MTDEIQAALAGKPFSRFSTGRQPAPKSRAVLIILAVIFASATIVYSFAWMYYIRWQPKVELGIEIEETPPKGVEITEVYGNSPAQAAGLQIHDLILAINEQDLATADPSFIRATWLK